MKKQKTKGFISFSFFFKLAPKWDGCFRYAFVTIQITGFTGKVTLPTFGQILVFLLLFVTYRQSEIAHRTQFIIKCKCAVHLITNVRKV